MKKTIIAIVCLSLITTMIFAFAACNNENDETQLSKYVVMTPDGAPSMALAKMMKDQMVFNNSVGEYTLISSEQVKTAFSNAEADFIIAPTNAGVQFCLKEHKYSLAAVTSWGNLYIVGDGIKSRNECESAQEFLTQLAGKKVGSVGAIGVPVDTLKHLLAQYDVEITIEAAEAPAIQAKLREGALVVAVLGEPAVTATLTNVEGAKRLANISSLWKEVVGQDFPQASLFVKNTVDKETVDAFLDAVNASIEYLNASSQNAKELGDYMESRKDSTLKGAIVGKSYLEMQQKLIKAKDVKDDVLAFVQILGVNATEETLNGIVYNG